jgi:methyl-accepting chemotaxis protein
MSARFKSPSARLTLLIIAVALLCFILEIIWPANFTSLIGLGVILAAGAVMLRQYDIPSEQAEVPAPLQPAAGQFDQTISLLSSAVESINQVTAQQVSGAKEQADLIGRTNTLLTDFVELSGRVQEQARSLTTSARQASESSESGGVAIRQAMDGMNGIRRRVSTIAGTMRRLSGFTRRIDDIIGSVSEIATQSNLLALNASIEAARAGVHGRGFAVVAEEVRSLSRQSTQSARQVRAILEEIQVTMKQAIEASEQGLQEVDTGLTMTGQADVVMTQLAENVASAQRVVNRVYEIIREQVEGLDEITIGIERMERVTQTNLNSSRSVETITGELTRLAADLQGVFTTSAGVNQNTHYHAENRAR